MTKRININFDSKSIKNAIKELNQIQKRLKEEIPSKFLDACLDMIISLANTNINNTTLDYRVKGNITGGWHKEVMGNYAKLVNDSEKAVFIEFGVGIVGQQNSHPMASEQGYEYNVESGYKLLDGLWVFDVSEEYGNDIEQQYVLNVWTTTNGGNAVETRGQPAIMYLYNAIMDMEAQNLYKKIWKEIIDKNL